MTLIVINSTLTNPASVVDLGTTNDLSVGRDGYATSTGASPAVVGSGSSHWVRVEGTLTGHIGLQLGDNGALDTLEQIVVSATGVISGELFAISLAAHDSQITNYGLIDGYFGISLTGSGSGQSTLRNMGDIHGFSVAVAAGFGEAINLLNTGTIMGQVSVAGSGKADIVRNQGAFFGAVDLAAGADLYDGRGGTVDSLIDCGAGFDTVRAGAGDEFIDGGADTDTLDFQFGGGIKVSLDGSVVATKTARDDIYINFENIIGSRQGNDVLGGDDGNNVLEGRGGADSLLGRAGQDTLNGGLGDDKLTGGAGNDRFVFNSVTEAGDTITDFRNIVGDDDVLFLSALGFGGGLTVGLVAGTQFQTRTDNLAQDADDRFIFNTTDRTLWFDVNGTGAGGLTLLVTVQPSATLTVADLQMI